jgi:hypothetical protein
MNATFPLSGVQAPPSYDELPPSQFPCQQRVSPKGAVRISGIWNPEQVLLFYSGRIFLQTS